MLWRTREAARVAPERRPGEAAAWFVQPDGAIDGVSEMKRSGSQSSRRGSPRRANTLVEYAIILVIVSIVAVVLLKAIGQSTNQLFESTNSNMPA